MKFKTRRRLFLIAIIAICLPISFLWTAIIVAPIVEALLLDYNDFYQWYDRKKA